MTYKHYHNPSRNANILVHPNDCFQPDMLGEAWVFCCEFEVQDREKAATLYHHHLKELQAQRVLKRLEQPY